MRDWREELIEQMANAMFASKQYNGCFALMDMACAALAVAEPVIRDKCAKIIEPSFPRPCDCEACYCGNRDDVQRVSAWDEAAANAKAIRDSRNCVPEGGKDGHQ